MARYGGGNCQISSNRVGPSHTANCGILIYYTKNINELMKCKEAINFMLVCPAQTKAMPKAQKMTSQASTSVCSSGYWIVITFCERDSVRTSFNSRRSIAVRGVGRMLLAHATDWEISSPSNAPAPKASFTCLPLTDTGELSMYSVPSWNQFFKLSFPRLNM